MAEENRLFEEGMTHYRAKNYEAAIQSFTKNLRKLPNHLGSICQRGGSWMQLREYEKAMQDFDKAIGLDDEIAAVYAERAVAKYQLKQYKEAISDFDKAVELEPDNAYRYSSRAYILASIGDKIGALHDYRKSLEINPNDPIVQNNLGLLEETLGYSKKAQERYAKADELLGITKEDRQARLDDAIEKYEQIEESRKANRVKPPEPAKPQTKDYFKVMKDVFTSKETFGDFMSFVKGRFSQKKADKESK
ncbi:hypothetical protein BKI52_18440 [marine bacterium AO1-C]|nr:hypothetical protein BKI52_18440 [marine bacterium AO1-C]